MVTILIGLLSFMVRAGERRKIIVISFLSCELISFLSGGEDSYFGEH